MSEDTVDPQTLMAVRDLGCYLVFTGNYKTGYDGERYNGGHFVGTFLGCEYGCYGALQTKGVDCKYIIAFSFAPEDPETRFSDYVVLHFDLPFAHHGVNQFRIMTNYRGVDDFELLDTEDYPLIKQVKQKLNDNEMRYSGVVRAVSPNLEIIMLWFLLYGKISEVVIPGSSQAWKKSVDQAILPLMMDDDYRTTVQKITGVIA